MLISSVVFGQYQNQKVRVADGSVVGTLPYAFGFYLVGEMPAGRDLIKFSIWQTGATPKKERSYYAKANSKGEFEVYVSETLKRGVAYSYSISYSHSGIIPQNSDNNVEMDGTNIAFETLSAKQLFELSKEQAAFSAFTGDGDGDGDGDGEEQELPKVKSTASRMNPVAGVGVGYLGIQGNSNVDMFGHIGFKAYFSGNVDRKLKNIEGDSSRTMAYRKPTDRLGILVAGAVTPMAFKGKALDNPVFNFKPMLGLTFDFMPELSADAGVMFFDYKRSDSSLISDLDGQLRMAFFFSISLDIDAFTRLRAAINNDPYLATNN
jgi:hypothetical protein